MGNFLFALHTRDAAICNSRRMPTATSDKPSKQKRAAHQLLDAVDRMIAAAKDAERARRGLKRKSLKGAGKSA